MDNRAALERYRLYEKKNKLNVFIVLGIGGEPIQPDEVYVVPLSKMKYSKETKEYLQPFKRADVSRRFYYDEANNVLK